MTGHRYHYIATGWRYYVDGQLLAIEHDPTMTGTGWEHVNTVRDEAQAVRFVRDRLNPAAAGADTAETNQPRRTEP